jgi:hypothetical protein
MNFYTTYVSLIILLKVIFICLAVAHIYNKAKGKTNTPQDKKIVYWKDRIEFVFIILMSLLLIYVFYPRSTKPVILDTETKILFYLFGFVLILTAKWKIFIKESPFHNISHGK